MPTDFTVTDEADLQNAIDAIDVGGASSATNTSYQINFAPGLTGAKAVTLTSSLDAINLASGDSLTIAGSGGTLDGGGSNRGFFVYSGRVTISNLTIQNAVAHGGTGVYDGGAGAGLGGGVFVASGGNVLLINDDIDGNRATGGNAIGDKAGPGAGGPGGGIGLTGNGFGTTGTAGTKGTAGTVDGGPGGDGGMGGPGGAGGSGGAGGTASFGDNGAGGAGGAGGFGGGGGVGGAGGVASLPGGGGAGGAGGFGGGGGGGGAGTVGTTFSGTGGNGGIAGFGGGGGGGGAGAGGSIMGAAGGTGAAGGFGGGAGGDGTAGGQNYAAGHEGTGGGGLGAGGGIFVQQGGTLTIEGGMVSGNEVGGGTGATSGAAFGAGLFFQGDNDLRLGAAAGQTSEIDDVIADQSGSGGTGSDTGQVDLTVIGTGTLKLAGANTYSGGTTIDSGTLELDSSSAAGNAANILFTTGAGATLQLDQAALPNGATFSRSIVGFDSTDKIDLRGLTYVAGATATYDPFAQAIDVTSNGITDTVPVLNYTGPTSFAAIEDAGGGTEAVLCFAAGTLIRTIAGDVPVEAIAVGDLVVTASGAARPVRWLGHREIDCASNAIPSEAWPVRIRAGAFGIGDEGCELPERDLFLSPGHPVLVGEHLVPIMCLINGTTIERVPVDRVSYWHVELDAHDILLAEGLPAESFLDWGTRCWFGPDADAHALADPDFVVPGLGARCRPVAIDGPIVEAERRRLDGAFQASLAAPCAWPAAESFTLAI